MINQQLLDYIKQGIDKGLLKDRMKQNLLDKGWPEAGINEAFAAAEDPNYMPKPEEPATKEKVRLLGLSELLEQAWRLYKTRFRTLLTIALLPLIATFLIGFPYGYSMEFIKNIGLDIPKIILKIKDIAAFILIILLQVWSYAALICAIRDSQAKIGTTEAFRRAWPKIIPLSWTFLLVFLICEMGFIFFIIPGIIFYIWFILASYIPMNENIGGLNALLKSKAYVQGHWWNVLGKALFILMLHIPIYALLILTNSQNETVKQTIQYLIINPISLFLAPLITAYSFQLYKNLKEAKGEFEFKPNKKGWTIFAAISGLIIGIVLASGAWSYLSR
jgi:hypothetical protein